MANSRVAHDCVLGNDIIIANSVAIAGHVHMDDHVIVGGAAGIHQFCKIGAHSFLGAGGIILRDVPPFVMVSGQKNIPQGINSEGLKRRGFSKEEVMAIKRAYKAYTVKAILSTKPLKNLPNPHRSSQVAFMVKFLQDSREALFANYVYAYPYRHGCRRALW